MNHVPFFLPCFFILPIPPFSTYPFLPPSYLFSLFSLYSLYSLFSHYPSLSYPAFNYFNFLVTVLTQTRLLNVTERFSFSEMTWQCLLTEIIFLEVKLEKNILSRMNLLNDSEKKISYDENFYFENLKFNEKISKKMSGIQNERKRFIIKNMKGKPILHIHHTQHKTPGFRVPLKPSNVQNPNIEILNNEKNEKSDNSESNSNDLNKTGSLKDDIVEKDEIKNIERKGSVEDEEDIEEIIENAQSRLQINAMKIKIKTELKKKINLNMTNENENEKEKEEIIEELIHGVIQFSSHENLVEFLEALCTYVPSLKGNEIDHYFHYCGI